MSLFHIAFYKFVALPDPEAVANRPVPRLVEGVLASECEALLARRATAAPKRYRLSDS